MKNELEQEEQKGRNIYRKVIAREYERRKEMDRKYNITHIKSICCGKQSHYFETLQVFPLIALHRVLHSTAHPTMSYLPCPSIHSTPNHVLSTVSFNPQHTQPCPIYHVLHPQHTQPCPIYHIPHSPTHPTMSYLPCTLFPKTPNHVQSTMHVIPQDTQPCSIYHALHSQDTDNVLYTTPFINNWDTRLRPIYHMKYPQDTQSCPIVYHTIPIPRIPTKAYIP